MQWLFPGFLIAAAAVALPIALHLLRRWPRQTVTFPALRFLAPTARRANTSTQRILRWLVLAMRCAALALLAAAFARPYRGSDLQHEYRVIVVVVDNSFSLQASGRWASLRAWAEEKTGRLAPGDKLGLALASPQPRWVATPTTDTEGTLTALRELAPGWALTHLEPTLRMAGEALAAIPSDRREIVVITDHQRLSWLGTDFGRSLPPGIRLSFPDVPAVLQRQAAILAPQITGSAEGVRASLSIRNFTDAQSRVLHVFREGEASPVHEETLWLGAQELRTLSVKLPAPPSGAAWYRFALDPDELPADDVSWAVWQTTESGTILLDRPAVPVSAGAPSQPGVDFVSRALAATNELRPSFKITPPPAGEWPVRSVAILRNDASFAGEALNRLNTFLAAGGSAIVFAGDGEAAGAWLATHKAELTPLPPQTAPWQVRDWRLEHPLVAVLGRHRLGVLLNWEFRGGRSIAAAEVDVLAHWSDNDAAIGEFRVGPGRVLVCGFAPDRQASDWPATPAFVQFLHQAAVYLDSTQHSAVAAGSVGQPVALGPRAGQWVARDGPTSGETAVGVQDAVVPLAPGVYEFTQGSDRAYFAINVPPEESDPAGWDAGQPWLKLASNEPAPPSGFALGDDAAPARVAAIEAEQRSSLWWWAIAAVGALVLFELLLANRTTR